MLQNRVGIANHGMNRLSHYPARSSCMYETPVMSSNNCVNYNENQASSASYQQPVLWRRPQKWQSQQYSNNVAQSCASLQRMMVSSWQTNNQYPFFSWQPSDQCVPCPWQPNNTCNFVPKQEPVNASTQDFIESFFTDFPAMEPQVTMPTNTNMITSPLEANPIQSLLNGKYLQNYYGHMYDYLNRSKV